MFNDDGLAEAMEASSNREARGELKNLQAEMLQTRQEVEQLKAWLSRLQAYVLPNTENTGGNNGR